MPEIFIFKYIDSFFFYISSATNRNVCNYMNVVPRSTGNTNNVTEN